MQYTPWVRLRFILAFILALVLLALCGCTAMFPREQGSRTAESAWLALHAVDTAQTIQIARHPECFHEANPLASAVYGTDHPSASRVAVTNVALALVHSSVSAWLDDRVASARASDSDMVGPWYVGRIAWHTVSLLGTGSAVVGNFSIGLKPTSARCP
jgi:hypothetical protein